VPVRRGGRRAAGPVDGGERVGQAAQQDTLVDELQEAAVEADGEPPAGEVVADGVLPTSQADHTDGTDQPIHLDRGCARRISQISASTSGAV
jgi:hypothetical protein